ncbi:DMT family transporter [Clostridium sediminicola]|uniref:DMT family transporter n=1 Tax=Clostridium sediminicola TaxID=3114879 RepID=UPI0031F2123F
MNSKEFKGVIIEIISGICYGAMGVLGVFLMKYGFDFISITMMMFLSLVIFNLLKILFTDISMFRISREYLVIVAFQGIVVINGLRLAYFYALNYLPAGICSIILFCMVFPLMYVSYIFFNEEITGKKITCSLVAVFGVALALNIFSQSGTGNIKGIIAMVLCVAFSVFNNALNRYYINTKLKTSTITFYFSLFGFFTLLTYQTIFEKSQSLFIIISNNVGAGEFLLILILFSIVCIGAVILLMYGLNYVSATHMGVCQAFDPISATMLGVVLFKDVFTLYQIIGIISIILSVSFMSFNIKIGSIKKGGCYE